MSKAGRDRRRRAQGARADQLQAALAALDPELAEWAEGFIFDEVWGRPGLDFERRLLVAITALAATDRQLQLRNYLFGAVQAGVPSEAIQEALVMLAVYCGFPVAINALVTWSEVRKSLAREAGEG
jgi:4-carboxymuconolactone decarboxylase